jgi:hypothetical protein
MSRVELALGVARRQGVEGVWQRIAMDLLRVKIAHQGFPSGLAAGGRAELREAQTILRE